MNKLNFIPKNKKISRGFFVSMLLTLPMLLEIEGIIQLISLLGFSLGMIFVFYHSLIAFKTSEQKFSIAYFLLGALIIVGGTLFDIMVTLSYSPDLKLEANPIVLTLLRLNLPFWAIYLISGLHQVCIVGSIILLWGVFLKNYSQIVKTIPYKNLFTTFKWLLGCGQMTFSDFMLNRNTNHYFGMLFFILTIVIAQLARWYFAMDWLEWVPRSNIIPILIVVSTLIISIIKIHSHVKASHLCLPDIK